VAKAKPSTVSKKAAVKPRKCEAKTESQASKTLSVETQMNVTNVKSEITF